MDMNLAAVIIGFVVTLVLSGLTAGYLAGGTMSSGVLHGSLATVIGSLVLLAIAAFTTQLLVGVVASFSVLVLACYAILGTLSGVIRSWAVTRWIVPPPAVART